MFLTKSTYFSMSILTLMVYTSTALAEYIKLDNPSSQHIDFGRRIQPNKFELKDDILSITVNNSASFKLFTFVKSKTIESVSFLWKKEGELLLDDAEHEEQKKGDDAYLRIGLMLEGDPGFISPLAPKWFKKVNKSLHIESGGIFYLIAGSQHQAGEQWLSPYNSDVTLIAVKSMADSIGWQRVDHKLKQPVSIVGLWVMADGDNTNSSFTTHLSDLHIN